MYSGTIKEYPGLVVLERSEEVSGFLYFRAGNTIVRLNRELEGKSLLQRGHQIFGMNITDQGLWIFYYSNEPGAHPIDDGYQEFVDLFDKGVDIVPPDFSVTGGTFLNNTCITVYGPNYSDYSLIVHDFQANHQKRTPTDFGFIATDGRLIYYTSSFSGVRCYDFGLNLVWEQEFTKKPSFYGPPEPILHKDLVIINQGVDGTMRDERQRPFGVGGCIAAYRKSDGALMWSRDFERGVLFSLAEGVLYAVSNGRIHLIDCQTGEIMLEKKAPIVDPHPYDRAWCDGSHIFYISLYESKILVLNQGGSLVQTLPIPQPYAPYDSHNMFTTYQGHYVLDLTRPGRFKTSYGLLILSPQTTDGPFEITCEPRPDYNIECLDVDGEKQEYRVTIREADIENAIRHGHILLKECALQYGAHIWSNGEENEKFNGHIRFKVEAAGVKKHAPRINAMIETFVTRSKMLGETAGDGTGPITVSLEL